MAGHCPALPAQQTLQWLFEEQQNTAHRFNDQKAWIIVFIYKEKKKSKQDWKHEDQGRGVCLF